MKADFHSLQMQTQNFGVSWSTKPPFRRALHCGRQRVFNESLIFQEVILASLTPVRMEVPVLFKETVVTRAVVLLDLAEITVKLQQVTHIPLHGK